MRFSERSIFVLASCLALVGLVLSGCDAIGSGPRTMKQVGEGVMTIGTTLASQMSPKNMTANAGGSVHNPEYQMTGFVATGVVWNMTLRLIGADLDFSIAAAGDGKVEPDEKILGVVRDIWARTDVTEQNREEMIAAAVADWIRSKATPPAKQQTPPEGGSSSPAGGK